ncbi:DUF4153 domain-containing protein [Flavobacterium sp. FBOR7N2.3]|uniref:DUF4153 domain-containing protein n=1 Tax=Flavobacterium magnesitis TaxID=3138077 RepID=A0ABV4THT1_9FLAO
MKFPSFQRTVDAIQKTVSRFPLETFTAITGTIIAMFLAEESNDNLENLYNKILLSCSLCFVLFLSISLYFTRNKKDNLIRFISSLALGTIIILFVFNFSDKIKQTEFFQFFTLNIALHLLVSFAAFLNKKYNQDHFWEFNKQLFIRILTAVLYSIVLYSGLALALLAVHNLFNIELYDKIYFHLFLFIAGTFNSIFFLSGISETNNPSETLELKYPEGLKKFTQYVLIPLISIYLVILIGYELKIVLSFSLPVGWVSNLILVFAVFGILSLLLIHPIAHQAENVWIRTFNKWFYYLLVPLLVLLYWAILYRIQLYGITHERYYVLALSIWLTLLVLYFIIKKEPKIMFIPISMSLIALCTIIGPQSANSVSKNSQLNRLENYLSKKDKTKLTFEQEQDLSSIIDFLVKNYDVKILLPLTDKKLDALVRKDKNPSSTQIMKALGYHYRSQYDRRDDENIYYSHYENEGQLVENIHDYDLSFNLSNNSTLNCSDCVTINQKKYSLLSTNTEDGIDLQINNDIIPLKTEAFIIDNIHFNSNSNEKIIQKIENSKYKLQLTYTYVYVNKTNKKPIVNSYNVKVLLKIK